MPNLFEYLAIWSVLNIHDLYVRETHRRQGIAKMLLGAAERLAKSKGCLALTIETGIANVPARRLYYYSGFEGTGILDDDSDVLFGDDPQEALKFIKIQMKKELK